MTTLFKIPQSPQTYLYSSIGSSDTSIRLTPFPQDLDGNNLTMSGAFGTFGTATIDPKVAGYEEIIGFTGIVDNGDGTCTLTGVTRDLQSTYPYTGTGTGKQHGSNATVVFGINPQTLNQFPSKNNDETINGQWAFPTPTSPQSAVNKAYADALAFNGAGPATTTSFGLVKISTTSGTTLGTCSITIASPAVITLNSHGLIAGDMVRFSTTGALPTGIVAGTTYFVVATVTTNTFSIAATAGGTAIVTTGSQSGTQTLIRMTPIAISDTDTRIPTANMIAALAGVSGVASATNKVFLAESASTNSIDQSQSTQNATIDVGVANTTGLHNKVAQSFIPLRTKMSAVRLYKAADTGSFTGSVTVAIFSDNGSPNASLASFTYTNAQWLLLATGEFSLTFGTELSGLVAGTTYWIVISTSTSDTSNHPNLGTNSAGGYANGSVKANNTTDGWFAIATIDLYFKTIEGNVNQLVETDSSGFIPIAFINNTPIGIDLTQKLASASGAYTISIPANTLGTNRVIKFRLLVSSISGTSGDTLTVAATYGGSSVGSVTFAPASSASGAACFIEGYIFANAATNAQKSQLNMIVSTTNQSAAFSSGGYAATSIDSTVPQNLVVTLSRTVNGGITTEGIVVTYA